jgi:phage gpG-like protein
MPLAPSTIKSNKRRYGAGHKILVGQGTLMNSVTWKARPGQVIIGTNLKYAAVHQFGSRDRGSIGFGPRTKDQQAATVEVKEHSYDRLQASLGTGRERITNARGRSQLVKRLVAGPRNASRVGVRSHARHQNIPARPYVVFRPEDPGRIQSLVNAYIRRASSAAGLGGE